MRVDRSQHCDENEHFIKLYKTCHKQTSRVRYSVHCAKCHCADSIQPDVMDVGVERTFSPQNFSMFPWE